jgi:ferritin-like metal-binding protein YciE
MNPQSLEDIFLIGLQYAYDAEKQLTESLPRLAKAAKAPQLRDAFETHLKETEEHVRRAEQVFSIFGQKPETKDNHVLKAMSKEADGMVTAIDAGPIRDAALIVAANQVEHYEMAAYGSLKIFAQLLSKPEAVKLLDQTLAEEKQADAKLTEVGEKHVNQQAAHYAPAGAGAR